MEVFVVNSLLELRQLRHLFCAFPDFIFTGGYVRVCVQVHRIDRVVHTLLFQRILADFAADFNCEVPSQEMIDDVASLTESLVVLKRMADEATRDLDSGELYDERRYQMMGRAAQIARENGAFASGSFGDLLFSVTKTAVSCANTGQDLLANNISSERRWGRLISRLLTLQFDVDLLLRSPVLL